MAKEIPKRYDASRIVERIQKGDQVAEAAMVERYHKGLVFALKRQCASPDVVEDIAQETWRLVIEKIRAGALRDPSALSRYIVQIGKNQMVMHYRRQRDTDGDEVLGGMASEAAPMCEEVELQQQKSRVVQVLGELATKRDEEMLRRFYIEEEEKDTICESMGVSSLHFNRVMFRARQRFRDLWENKK